MTWQQKTPTPVSEERGQMDKDEPIPREIFTNPLHLFVYSKYLEVNRQSLKLDTYGFSTLSSFLRKTVETMA